MDKKSSDAEFAMFFRTEYPGVVRAEFSEDPRWDALNNRLVPEPVPITRQHFGWRDTNHAGGNIETILSSMPPLVAWS